MVKLVLFVAEIYRQLSFFRVHFPILLEGQMAVGGLDEARKYDQAPPHCSCRCGRANIRHPLLAHPTVLHGLTLRCEAPNQDGAITIHSRNFEALSPLDALLGLAPAAGPQRCRTGNARLSG